ncbi:putative COMPASS complex subunit Sdc1 [Aspergillus steynii IBT 23096]|uniref:Putative COMPASS complex subunit Sdc1 n=1 Tax=Aspergillus steynii IBT 23096 TaxID=1392250 RepID=A0A2I2FZG4_9EURO|nr:putative COMPASS complex subunit Sdc1 [Aspergillus steynii IBT 23096]PLB46023.1 putative COMPASS complex subunit Sdc1 [Aspergillus steynii IBT 23096]
MGNDSAANTPAADSTASAPMRPGGAPARVYMNERIVPYLLEGMKVVAKEQPSNPLRVLGEFLIQKSSEVEGGGAGGANKTPE